MKFPLRSLNKLKRKIIVVVIMMILFFFFQGRNQNSVEKFKRTLFDCEIGSSKMNYPLATKYERKDWHDWQFIEYEKSRVGPGEQGKPYYLTDPKDIELNDKLYKVEGLNALVSDKISVNRSLPDTRRAEYVLSYSSSLWQYRKAKYLFGFQV